jgi:hypothetical protein
VAGVPVFAGDFETFTDNTLNGTQRNIAYLAVRGNQTPEVIAVMRSALDNSTLQACAGTNLRIAGALEELLGALEDKDPTARAVAAWEFAALHAEQARRRNMSCLRRYGRRRRIPIFWSRAMP